MSEPAKGASMAQGILSRPDLTSHATIRALDCLSHAKAISGDSNGARADEERALHLLDTPRFPDKFRANILSNAGAIFQMVGEPYRPAELFKQAYVLGKNNHIPEAEMAALMNMADLYTDALNDPLSADPYYRQAIELGKSIGRDDIYMYYNYGFNLMQLKRYDDALQVMNHVVEMAKGQDHYAGVRYRANADRAKIFLATGDSQRARTLLNESIFGLRRLPDVEGEAEALLTLAELQLDAKEDQAALSSAQRVLTLGEQSKLSQVQLKAMRLLVRVYAAMNQAGMALSFEQRANAFEISELKSQNYKGMASLESQLRDQAIQYQNERLQAQIEIQTLKIKRANLLRAGLIGALAAVLGLSCAFFVYQRRVSRNLQALSTTDSLSGLLNRREAIRILGLHRQSLEKITHGRAALLLIDADHFKAVNDTHGHDAGDRVLAELSTRLLAICRPDDLVARWVAKNS